jgi:ATP-binding cassette subfamily F protein 3
MLLDGASFAIGDRQKVGFIGRNGCGKSTLCRAIIGTEELDGGEIAMHKELRLGYLEQHDPFQEGESALDFLLRDSGQPDWKCGEVAGKFGLKGELLNGPLSALSGGWRTRVKVAALLLHEPNVLLLDEPTNFLDLRTQIMLEGFLKGYPGACLIVSHDRTFLERTCDHTLHLSRGRLQMYPGGIEKFLEHKDERRAQIQSRNSVTQAKRRQLETFIAKNKAGANTASQARSKQKQLDKLKLEVVDGEERVVRLRLPDVDPPRGNAVRCNKLAIGYPDLLVADQIQLDIRHRERVLVTGDNGQGKTTFLRTLTGSLEPKAGEVRWGHACETGIYAQHVYQSLPPDWTIDHYLMNCATRDATAQTVRDVAGSFLFSGDDIKKSISVLSGGERARVCLAGLLLGRHNTLVMDEPGNHLDVETVEALADALIAFPGTVIFTSHDRHFMKRVATNVIEVKDGRVAHYPGDYDAYLYRVSKEIEEQGRDGGKAGKAGKGETPELSREARKAEARRLHQLRKQIKKVERQIEKLSEKRAATQEKLVVTTDGTLAKSLRDLDARHAEEIAELEARWLELEGEAENG